MGTVHASPGVLYVAPSAQGSSDCFSWANACTLQTALTTAVSGDEIWVKAGTYTPGSARTDSFRIQRNVQLYGGFVGTETARDQRNWVANPTILSGDIGTVGNNSDNAYHVVVVNGVTYENITSATVIDGFTITAGNANGSSPDDRGGGLYCDGRNSGHECSPTLTNVTFSGNSATYGGGMYNNGNSGTSSRTLTNVTFYGNHAITTGGGMYNYDFFGTSSPTLTNTIMWGNTASDPAINSEIYNASDSPTFTVSYSDIQGGNSGTGNIDAGPKFVNAAGGNLRLNFGSPAIDAGNNAAVPGGITTDLDGNPRFVDIRSVSDTGNGTPPIVIWVHTRPVTPSSCRWCSETTRNRARPPNLPLCNPFD